jgi:serine/threonine protein kinase
MGNKASGAEAYTINLIPENKIGGGTYADVYKILKNDTKELCAAKFLKVPISFFSSLD